MASEETHPMGLHLPGLLQILGEHLYSNPLVALREAVQNAHDSCQRRRVEEADPDYQPQVEVRPDAEGGELVIRDNGSGLTRDEVHEFLATIGRSYTGELRGQLEFSDTEAAGSLVGQFGLGLLSGFLLARSVTLTTRSYRPGSPTLEWRADGGQTYALREVGEGPVGSTLRLTLKPAARFLLEAAALRSAVGQFVAFLSIPVLVGDGDEPVNTGAAPWHEDAGEEAYRDFVRERFGVEPLTVLPLRDHVEDLPGDRLTVPLRGVLFIPPGSVTSLQEYGDVAVYVRRMFICERERDLLPPWARFVRGVVESPRLRPTVSRESLRQDDSFQQIRAGLGAQLLAHLQGLARDQPEVWREIVLGHNDLIKGWSVQEPALFEAVADLVDFQTSRGRLTLPQVREVTGERLYYFSDDTGSNQEKMLYEAAGLLVVDASRFAEEAFLKRYAASRPEVVLEQLEPGTTTFFRAAPDDSLPAVTAYYEGRDVSCRVVEFSPPSLPALLVYPPAHDQLRRVRDVVDSGGVKGPLAELMSDYLERRAPSHVEQGPVLHLNAGNELLQSLEQVGTGAFRFAPALDLILEAARFLAGKDMTAAQSRQAYEQALAALNTLVQLAARGDP